VANPIYLYKGDFTSTYTISSPGYYLITEDIEFTASGYAINITTGHVTVDLNGHTLYNTGSGTRGINAEAVEDTTIKNGTISGFSQNDISLSTVTRYNISNCTLLSTGNGIWIVECYDGRIIDCNCVQNNATGLGIEDGNKLYVTNSHFDDNGEGAYLDNIESFIFEDCTFNLNEIGCDASGSGILRNCIAADNSASDSDPCYGFNLVGDIMCQSCTALSNSSENQVCYGFYVDDAGVKLMQCKSNDNSTTGGTADGIYIDAAGTITECSCYNNTSYGIENDSATSIIVGNKAGNNTTADYGGTNTPISTAINQLGDNDVPPLSDYTNIRYVSFI